VTPAAFLVLSVVAVAIGVGIAYELDRLVLRRWLGDDRIV
jgi:hypothetical protein